ncbi:MAG TPA: hypothetical protein PKC72_06570 [Chitinophagaceae bacterium]|nr:hypothetical protein [Chitinophagaceae bacterium]
MLKSIIICLTLLHGFVFAQSDSTKQLRAFPVTDYIIDLNDSTKLVQLELPDGITIKYKQLGLIHGVYNSSSTDTVSKGFGRCYLIKGDYYYFAIGQNNSGISIKKGDLLYTFMDKTDIWNGRIPKLASHFIQLQDVYENRFYDRYLIFKNWTENEERLLLDSMVADIRFTGKYFQENDPSIDIVLKSGKYKGNKVLSVMIGCKAEDVTDFIDYVIARPRLYAGRQWKLSEVFATWLEAGAPTTVKE